MKYGPATRDAIKPDEWWGGPDDLAAGYALAAIGCLPSAARVADQDERGGAHLLPLLAECSGPIGPALSLATAYLLGARHASDRVAGVDAFLALVPQDPAYAARSVATWATSARAAR